MHTPHLLPALLAAFLSLLASCGGGSSAAPGEEENAEAKRLMQGVWLGEDDAVSLRVKGDTITYADSTMAPVAFAIIGDSLVLRGHREARYAIVKQTPHLFVFRNGTGDVVRLMKSDDKSNEALFNTRPAAALNQRRLIKRDTVVNAGATRLRVYTQVNPSTYKVVRTLLNADGVEVDNVYYDNIINICVYDGPRRLFSRDFRKQDFSRHVPHGYLTQSVLSDITVAAVTAKAVVLAASLCVPDSPTSYVVNITITTAGGMSMRTAG